LTRRIRGRFDGQSVRSRGAAVGRDPGAKGCDDDDNGNDDENDRDDDDCDDDGGGAGAAAACAEPAVWTRGSIDDDDDDCDAAAAARALAFAVARANCPRVRGDPRSDAKTGVGADSTWVGVGHVS